MRKIGLPPGTLIHVGDKKPDHVKITLLDYDSQGLREKEPKSIEECIPFHDTPSITWINVVGLHQVDVLEKLGKGFGLHPLVMEDILFTDQRPKMEDFDDHIFIVLRAFSFNVKGEVITEQISLVLGINFVITFQEIESTIFQNIKERIRSGKGRIRRMGADYLAYAVLDAIVDNYFIVLEKLENNIEIIEDTYLKKDSPKILLKTQNIKKDLLMIRQAVWPLRDVINQLVRGEFSLIREDTDIYYRDVHDHTTQIIDTLETLRESMSSIFDIYLSTTSNKLNAIMKVLTVISTVFMPLNFIAGIYGMNFEFMPGLNHPWGYPVVLTIMVLVVCVMIVFFKNKKWI